MRLRLRPLDKKYLPCLRCGRQMLTDAARRFRRRCRRLNADVYVGPVYGVSREIGEASR